MMCPLCGLDVLPEKVCLNCGYDPSRPGAHPSGKPSIPSAPRQDNTYSTRDVSQAVTERKAAKPKSKEISFEGYVRKPDQWQPEWIVKKYFRGPEPGRKK